MTIRLSCGPHIVYLVVPRLCEAAHLASHIIFSPLCLLRVATTSIGQVQHGTLSGYVFVEMLSSLKYKQWWGRELRKKERPLRQEVDYNSCILRVIPGSFDCCVPIMFTLVSTTRLTVLTSVTVGLISGSSGADSSDYSVCLGIWFCRYWPENDCRD